MAVQSILDDLKTGMKAIKEIIKKLEKKKDAKEEIKTFEKEPIYAKFLLDFERAHADLFKRELFRFEIDRKNAKKEKEILLDHYVFLQKVCENLKRIIEDVGFYKSNEGDSLVDKIAETCREDVYTQENGRLRVIDKEMSLDIDEQLPTTASGELHGLSVFTSDIGQVLSKTLFLNGKKEGKCFRFYPNGHPAAVLRYRKNNPEGNQKYYYRNGTLRSELNYKNGNYHGLQLLYYPNGKMKSEFHFVDGEREGEERRWYENGELHIQARYKNNQPIGVAKEWFDDGKLKIEAIYSDENPQYCKVKHYDREGVLLAEEDVEKNDFFEVFARKISILTMNLKGMREHAALMLIEATKSLNCDEETIKEITEKLSNISKELEVLEGLNAKILEAVGLESHATEPIWKSPQVRTALEEQYSQVADELQKGLDAIRGSLYELVVKMSELKHD
jgi:antitoxin component YwqK of YwqJK toxin-antitoxin module